MDNLLQELSTQEDVSELSELLLAMQFKQKERI